MESKVLFILLVLAMFVQGAMLIAVFSAELPSTYNIEFGDSP